MLLVSSGQARHAAEYAAMCKTLPKTKNYLAQKLSSVEVEKPWVVKLRPHKHELLVYIYISWMFSVLCIFIIL